MGNQVYWVGKPPTRCQVGDEVITDTFIDGRTQWGPWACMCKECWETHGEGLGIGKGQMYARQADGRWLKREVPQSRELDDAVDALEDEWRRVEQERIDMMRAVHAQLRAGPKVTEIWDYPIGHDGDLDNPVR